VAAIDEVPYALRHAAQAVSANRGRASQLRRLFERSLIPMAMLDSDGRYRDVNAAGRLLSRMSLEEIRGRRFGDFTAPEDRSALLDGWSKMMERGSVNGRTFVTFKDGIGLSLLYAGFANALPGEHLIVFVPTDWPDDRPEGTELLPPEPPEVSLSQRQLEVLRLVAVGANASQIGEQLSISQATVRTHVKNILERLGANNRAHAVALAMTRGLLGENPAHRFG
jgi:PAS domain S-box-containing protein